MGRLNDLREVLPDGRVENLPEPAGCVGEEGPDQPGLQCRVPVGMLPQDRPILDRAAVPFALP